MKSGFGLRLFRLLVYFAVIPAVVMAGLGLYLAHETIRFAQGTAQVDLPAWIEQQRADDQERSRRAIESYLRHDSLPTNTDLLFVVDDSSASVVRNRPGINDSLLTTAAERAGETDAIVIDCGGCWVQLVCTTVSKERRICCGDAYDSSHMALIATVQTSQAGRVVDRNITRTYYVFLILIFALIVGMAAIVAYLLARRMALRMSAPLIELTAATRDLAVGGFDRRVTLSASDELGELIRHFNHMAEQLEDTTQALAQSERVAAWRNVARRFAHELKNPLQPIVISLYRIQKQLEDKPDFESIREPLRAAGEELAHLTKLAERFSELSKLPPPKLETIELGGLLQSIGELYNDQMHDRVFAIKIPTEPTVVALDVTYFREVIHNLLRNGIEATATGDTITLSGAAIGQRAKVAVTDTGTGMAAEALASARLPYFTTKPKGTGLGLAIVEKIVTECHGKLDVVSRPGAGTTVTITLPRIASDHESTPADS
ncbi:MAG: ATP-binding protein [bacterium]